jgi:NAD(P)H-hydrate epimerase
LDATLMEALKAALPEDHEGRLSAAALGRALELAADKTVVAVGPGLGRSEGLETFLGGLASEIGAPLVIDADGLNNLAGNLPLLRRLERPIVLTPHPGEAARLLGATSRQIQEDRLGAARRLAKEAGAIVVLKGARTVTAEPTGQVWINPTGNPGMAAGGMGDVLTGLIAGFMAQKADPLRAAVASVFVHGLAADRAAATTGERALTAGAVLEALPGVFKELEDSARGREWDEGVSASVDALFEEALRDAQVNTKDDEKWRA